MLRVLLLVLMGTNILWPSLVVASEAGSIDATTLFEKVRARAAAITSGRFEYVQEQTRFESNGKQLTSKSRYEVLLDGKRLRHTCQLDSLSIMTADKDDYGLGTISGLTKALNDGAVTTSPDRSVYAAFNDTSYSYSEQRKLLLVGVTEKRGGMPTHQAFDLRTADVLRVIDPQLLAKHEYVMAPIVIEHRDGMTRARVGLSSAKSHLKKRLWIDLDDYVLVKAEGEYTEPGKERKTTLDVRYERDKRTGLLYPTRVTTRFYEKDELRMIRVLKTEKVEINLPVAKDEFTLKAIGLKRNTLVRDAKSGHHIGFWNGSDIVAPGRTKGCIRKPDRIRLHEITTQPSAQEDHTEVEKER